MKNYLVVIPTFNEVANIGRLISKIRSQKIPNLDILVVDDNSPDQTAGVVKTIQQRDRKLFLLSRKSKMGIGSAHQAGIAWAYQHGYQKVITMDSDLTHNPRFFRPLVQALEKNAVVIASRYIVPNSMLSWKFSRKCLTYVNHFLIKFFFKINWDVSNAFRIYNLKLIKRSLWQRIQAPGYAFFFESLVVFKKAGLQVGEIGVIMQERIRGKSKMVFLDVLRQIFTMLRIYFRHYE